MLIFHDGGFFFASSIDSHASVFWCPGVCSHVLPVAAERAQSSPVADAFDLSALFCRISVLLTGDGHQHVVFTDDGRNLQLTVSGATLFEPARLTASVIWPPAELKQRLRGLECLNSLRSTGRLPARFFRPEPRRARLRWVLRALDGSIAGVLHREIGVALFGEARVDDDWADPGDHLRDIVRRAVRRGRALMNGGYRQFLR
ncbi:DUF2285 domain-containing protein [Mesorhizobium sp. WSM4884]|uniref:DNA -binding domain-containing protein n=1 Tax=Mesorhizobium sp. WSM4884 TaxID=3038542 RepID=UPI002415A71F|nr:DUF2285 domain-containing protein [Mesorhizobium sp. WSM4884]MDG4882025.1 DUF2285 domain-containing protein [Mesorhizobium sp. WSM4884]